MAHLEYGKLPKYTEGMNEFVAQKMEGAWRKRRRTLEQDLSELQGAYATLQSCYWKYDFHRENTALKGSMEGTGKLLVKEISIVSEGLGECISRIGEYVTRSNREPITSRK